MSVSTPYHLDAKCVVNNQEVKAPSTKPAHVTPRATANYARLWTISGLSLSAGACFLPLVSWAIFAAVSVLVTLTCIRLEKKRSTKADAKNLASVTSQAAKLNYRKIAAIIVFAISSFALGNHGSAQDISGLLDSLAKPYQRAARNIQNDLPRFEKELEQLKSEFKAQLTVAYQQAQYELPANGKLIQDQAQAVQDWLDEGGDLPMSHMLLPKIYEYAGHVHRLKEKHLKPKVTHLVRQLNQSKDYDEKGLEISNAYYSLGGVTSAASILQPDKKFGGTRWKEGSDEHVRIAFYIKNAATNTVSGEVHRDMGFSHHPEHAMQGGFDGNCIRLLTGATLKPGNRLDDGVVYEGIIIGRTIIGKYAINDPKRKPSGGYFRVDQL